MNTNDSLKSLEVSTHVYKIACNSAALYTEEYRNELWDEIFLDQFRAIYQSKRISYQTVNDYSVMLEQNSIIHVSIDRYSNIICFSDWYLCIHTEENYFLHNDSKSIKKGNYSFFYTMTTDLTFYDYRCKNF